MIQQPDVEVTLALRTYPLRPVPPSLPSKIVARINDSAQPRFHLDWLDGALSLLPTGVAGLSVLLWQQIPATQVLHFKLVLLLAAHHSKLILLESFRWLGHH